MAQKCRGPGRGRKQPVKRRVGPKAWDWKSPSGTSRLQKAESGVTHAAGPRGQRALPAGAVRPKEREGGAGALKRRDEAAHSRNAGRSGPAAASRGYWKPESPESSLPATLLSPPAASRRPLLPPQQGRFRLVRCWEWSPETCPGAQRPDHEESGFPASLGGKRSRMGGWLAGGGKAAADTEVGEGRHLGWRWLPTQGLGQDTNPAVCP